MVDYFVKVGDEDIAEIYLPYIWSEFGLGTLLKQHLVGEIYGKDLNLLLIKYYVEGRFSRYLPQLPKVNNYMSKSKDIGVDVPVTRELFHDRNEFERREFIVDSTINAVELVSEKLRKKKLDINFDLLMIDLEEISAKYLKKKEPYWINSKED